MEFFTILCWCVGSLLASVYLYFKHKFSYWKKRGVMYLEPSFPLGNLILSEPLINAVERVYSRKSENKVMGLYVMHHPMLVLTDLDIIQDILVKDFDSFTDRGAYYNEKDDPLMANLLTLDGDKWKGRRAKLTPTFTSAKMKFMYPTLIEIAKNFQQTMWDLVGNESELEMKEICGRFTSDVIGSCIFGIELNTINDSESAFRYYGNKCIEKPHLNLKAGLLATAFRDWARMLHVTLLSKDVSDFFIKSITDLITYRTEHNLHRNDFMELLIQLRNETMQDSAKEKTQIDVETAAEAFMFFIAGFETSSTVMMLACYELAMNPDIQEKARQEIIDTLECHNGELTYEALQAMTYIDMIISEILRKHPPSSYIPRKAVQNYRLADSNIVIEKDTVLVIPVYHIHHDPDIYPEPEIFDPERFSSDEIRSRHSMSFLGFGAGPRNCVGMRFGRMMTRIGLITLLQKFCFKTTALTPQVIEYETNKVLLLPKGRVVLQVERIV